ncbi:Virulence-associated protein [Bathymodiolus thermophilus thioautotrophic gill symbiont]|uniref:Virulence-associated protein n=1 Tax=Bathymodiolus thermophilus thioautotrophic gill symbiont TaxID=2360 RepID=A0A3G3IKN0_9GAMM|nr:type II toxin-antitoxin system VapB family antitoxin [Bathymodiolus thermophilus thioautotrophic gill symbiont]AYQ56397.1 Virulence-associated protein [Bathymodiolus thermophilus thioautotrophic gill symbiont]
MLAKVFQSGNSQAVRLPKAMRFDVSEVEIERVGESLVLTPYKKPDWQKMSDALDQFKALDFEFDRNQPQQIRDDLF